MNPRYELLHRVSRTAQGSVWQARDRETGGIVAVKQPGGPAALLRIQHPHVIRVLDVEDDHMVMEWMEGETLEAHGRLSAAEFDTLVRQSLDGLAAIHDAGLLHLDLKPENILITDAGFLISDLGSTKPAADACADAQGSVHYMAPECFEGGTVDARTDLYALGGVFYFALTGRTAFEGELAPQVITAHLQHRCVPLPESVPALLRHWVDHLMRRHATDRPGSAREAWATYRAIAQIVADA